MITVADTVAVIAVKGLGLGFLRACQSTCNFSVADQISAMIQTCDAVAPPPVKPTTYRIRRRTLLRRKQRTKRRLSGDDSGDAGNEGFLFGDGGNSPFDSSGGFGSGGGSWNFNRFGGGHNWDESSVPDPAFDFVYQVLSWIMLSNCLHFSFKRIVQIVAAASIVDSDREKVPSRLVPVC